MNKFNVTSMLKKIKENDKDYLKKTYFPLVKNQYYVMDCCKKRVVAAILNDEGLASVYSEVKDAIEKMKKIISGAKHKKATPPPQTAKLFWPKEVWPPMPDISVDLAKVKTDFDLDILVLTGITNPENDPSRGVIEGHMESIADRVGLFLVSGLPAVLAFRKAFRHFANFLLIQKGPENTLENNIPGKDKRRNLSPESKKQITGLVNKLKEAYKKAKEFLPWIIKSKNTGGVLNELLSLSKENLENIVSKDKEINQWLISVNKSKYAQEISECEEILTSLLEEYRFDIVEGNKMTCTNKTRRYGEGGLGKDESFTFDI